MDKKNFQIFDFNEDPIRVVILGDEPWFVVRDICVVLEIEDSHKIGEAMLEDDDIAALTDIIDSLGKKSAVHVVNNAGLYELIFRNAQPNKPEHAEFKKWISHTVLPFLYKTGRFSELPKMEIQLGGKPFHFFPRKSLEICSPNGTCNEMRCSFGRIVPLSKKEVI